MSERKIAAEVLDGLREIRQHRAGKRTLRTIRVGPQPIEDMDQQQASSGNRHRKHGALRDENTSRLE